MLARWLTISILVGGPVWAAATPGVAKPAEVSSTAIPRFAEVVPGLYRGGQPTLDGMRVLLARGVKTIVSLRPANEYPADGQRAEEAFARANGMTLSRVPIALHPTDKDVNEALGIIQKAKAAGGVFVHCYYGSERTGVIIGSYRVRFQGWTVERALAEAETHGISFRGGDYKELLRKFAKPAAPA